MDEQTGQSQVRPDVYKFPASFAQQRLWLVDQLAPTGSLYSMSRVLRLDGPLDVTALAETVAWIVARHETLRTTFAWDGVELSQLIHADGQPDFEFEDMTGVPVAEREEALRSRVRAECEKGFDLTTGPLFRCRLFQRDDQQYVLTVNMHHIISDGWSMDLLAREMSVVYGDLCRHRTPNLPELAIQYADYTVWQREWLTGDRLDDLRSYWVNQLVGVPSLELPLDHPRPPLQTYNGSHYSFEIPAALSAPLLSLGKSQGATPFMTLWAVFAVLMCRYSGQRDFCIGSPIANRSKPELEPLIGFFVNTLVLRAQVDPQQTFPEFLRVVRSTALNAYSNQDFPFEKIVEALSPERDRSRPPIVQVMFSFNEAGDGSLELADLQVSRFSFGTERGTAKFDLILFITEHSEGLRAAFEYNTDLFDATTIQRLARHLGNLVAAIVDDDSVPISRLRMLSDTETRNLLLEWNRTGTDYPRDTGLADLFHTAVDRNPDGVAVDHNGDVLSYRDLDQRANRLAHYLLRQGVTAGHSVGICLRPSLDGVIATVAVIKTGAVYIPLDAEYPAERLQFMVSDVAARVVITEDALVDRLLRASATLLCVDRLSVELAQESDRRPVLAGNPDALAYVIYTSGSTGTPKGVAVAHRAIARLVLDTDYVQLGPDERLAHVSNFAFDAATFELWGALLNGATVVVIDRDRVLAGGEFARELRERGITTMFMTTALFNVMAQSVPDVFASLKNLLVGGEALDPARIRSVLTSGPPNRLLNVYGPTENTTFSTWYPITRVDRNTHTIPIGRPIANTQTYVLDQHRQPVPVGVFGELYLGGDGLARGYWNRSDLTAEAFVENPFVEDRESRLYKTGDIVRYRPDGNIEFVGRNDNQVKLRGFRIELGEVETRIGRYAGVKDNVVVLRNDDRRGPRLVAYVVSEHGTSFDERAVKAALVKQLPHYMIPSAFVSMNALPLTHNGKIDRAALPAPRDAEVEATAYDAGSLEERISRIWGEILELDEIAPDANFFDLGGHSLLGVRLLFELEKQLGRKLPLSALFETPTVGGLASLLRDRQEAGGSSVAAIQVEGEKPPFFCIHGDPSILGPYLENDQPYYFLHHGAGDKHVMYLSVEELTRQHLSEVREIQPRGPYFLGGFSFGGLLAFEMAKRLVAAGETVALLALFDPTSPSVGHKGPEWNVRFHLNEMAKFDTHQDKFAYGIRKVMAKATAKFMKARKRLAVFQYRVYLRFNWPVPPQVVFRYNYEMFKRAAQEYVYTPYSGAVTLFHPETGHKRSRQYYEMLSEVWAELADGGIRTLVVPGTSKHMDLFRKPYVEGLAEQLTSCLAEARRSQARKAARAEE